MAPRMTSSGQPDKSYFNDISGGVVDFCRMLRYDRLEETDLSYHTEQKGPSRNGNIVKYGFQQCPYFTIVRETTPWVGCVHIHRHVSVQCSVVKLHTTLNQLTAKRVRSRVPCLFRFRDHAKLPRSTSYRIMCVPLLFQGAQTGCCRDRNCNSYPKQGCPGRSSYQSRPARLVTTAWSAVAIFRKPYVFGNTPHAKPNISLEQHSVAFEELDTVKLIVPFSSRRNSNMKQSEKYMVLAAILAVCLAVSHSYPTVRDYRIWPQYQPSWPPRYRGGPDGWEQCFLSFALPRERYPPGRHWRAGPYLYGSNAAS